MYFQDLIEGEKRIEAISPIETNINTIRFLLKQS